MAAPEQAQAGQRTEAGRPRNRRPSWVRLLTWLGKGLVLFLVLVLTAVAGIFWWLRTDSAHSLIVEQVNPILTEALAPQGLDAAITRLDGDLPLAASIGLTVSDAKGIWLTVPELRFDIDWSWQDRTVALRELVCVAPQVARLPELPASPGPAQDGTPPAPTPEPEALRQQLNQAGQALFTLPDWLPRVDVHNIAIEKATLATDVLGFGLVADLGLKASVTPSAPGGPQATFALTALDIESDVLRLRTVLDWKNAPGQASLVPWLDGPLSGSVALEFTPPASQQGQLGAPAPQGLLTGALSGIPALAKPASLSLTLAGSILAPQVGLQMDALGLEGSINASAGLPTDNWGQAWATLPRLVADMALHLERWQDINAFAPGLDLSGVVDVKFHAANTDGPLGASLDCDIPRFAMGQQLALSGLAGRISMDDVLGALRCRTSLGVEQIAAAGMKLGASLRLEGPLAQLLPRQEGQAGAIPDSGPITLALETHGDVPAKLDARWHAGSLHTPGCVVHLPQGTVELAARLDGLPGLSGTARQPSGDFRVVARDLDVRRFVPDLPLEPFDATLTGKLGKTLDARLDLPAKTLKTLGADSMKCTASVPLVYGANGIPSPDSKGPLKAQLVWHGQIAPLWALVPQADRRLKGRLDMDVQVAGSMEAPQLKGKVSAGKCRFEDVALGVILQDMGLNIALDGKMGPDNTPDGQAQLDFVAQDGMGGSLTLKGRSRLDGTGLDMRAKMDNLRPLRRHDARVALSGQAHVTGEATAPDVRGEIRINMAAIMLDNLSTGASSVTTLPIAETGKAKASPKRQDTTAKNGKNRQKGPDTTAPVKAAAKPVATGKRGSLHLDIITPGRIIVDGRGLVSEWKTEMQIRGTPDEPLITGGLRATKGKLDFMNRMFEMTRGVVTFAGGSVGNPILDIFLTNTRQGFTSHIAVTGPARKIRLELSSEPPMPRDEVLSHILFGRNVNELGRLETLQLAAAVAQLAGLGNGGNPLEFTRKALGVDVLRVNSGSGGGGGQGNDSGIGNASVEAGKYLTEDIYIGVQQGAKPNSTAGVLELELTPRTRVQVRSEQNNTGAQLNWKMDY